VQGLFAKTKAFMAILLSRGAFFGFSEYTQPNSRVYTQLQLSSVEYYMNTVPMLASAHSFEVMSLSMTMGSGWRWAAASARVFVLITPLLVAAAAAAGPLGPCTVDRHALGALTPQQCAHAARPASPVARGVSRFPCTYTCSQCM
jgi:hypothetical protein